MTAFFGIIVAAIVGLTVYLIYQPLIGKMAGAGSNKAKQATGKANSKEAIISTLNEIEFDYKMNKLSEADYKELKERYVAIADQMLKEEEQLTASKKKRKNGKSVTIEEEIDQEIEEALLALRKKTTRPK